MVKVSGKLILILFIFLIIAFINILIATIVIKNIEDDSEIINSVSIIRSSIQRVCKLELLNMPDDKLIKDIDNRINSILHGRIQVSIFKTEETKFLETQKILKNYWEDLKVSIYEYRKNPNVENKRVLVGKSEKIWDRSNRAIFFVESLYKKETRLFRYLIVSIAVNLLLIIVEILIINKFVKGRLEYYANYDMLTKVLNRNAFDIILDREIDIARRHHRVFSIIMIDIDFFKEINDSHGHDTGDDVLIRISRLILDNIRKIDYFARIGGDEFLIINLEQDLDKVEEMAEKLRKIIANHSFKRDNKVTISLGITQYNPEDTKNSILKRVDIALYKAKSGGKNRIEKEIL